MTKQPPWQPPSQSPSIDNASSPHCDPDGKDYREAMSRVVGAVHIITTGGEAGIAGFTATAVTSVSDSPPTVLVCLNSDSRSLDIIKANKTFCINTLAAHHESISDIFAGRGGVYGAARFEHGAWEIKKEQIKKGELNAKHSENTCYNPTLKDAIASFSCRVMSITPIATHEVIMGEVYKVTLGTPSPALAYHARRYISV